MNSLNKLISFTFGLFFIFQTAAAVQADKGGLNEIEIEGLKDHLEYLASDELKGRYPGTEGCKMAADHIRNSFREAGLKPLGENYFQYFDVVTNVKAGANNRLEFDDFQGIVDQDFVPYSFSNNTTLSAEIVFAGYGFDIENDSINWHDYKNIDVSGKWVMLLRGDPDMHEQNSPFIPHSGERTKVLTAKDKGAAGVIFVTGVEMEKEDNLVSMYYDKSSASSGLPVINVKRSVANKLLSSANKRVEELEKALNESRKPHSFKISTKLTVTTDVVREKARTQNVVGLLEGSEPTLKDKYVVLGAHYDHLGMGGEGSGSRAPDTVAVHNGADDNASGTTALIEIAEKLSSMNEGFGRSIVFIAFGAEEMGILGSKYFTKNPLIDLKKVEAMVNMDMLGRLNEDNEIMLGGTGTSKEADSLLGMLIDPTGIKYSSSEAGFGPSDHAAFYAEDIPVFFISSGPHQDYHTPQDDYDKIDYPGLKQLSDLTADLVFELADRDDKLTFQQAGPKSRGKYGRRFKVTLGIMPDITGSNDNGLRVDGVRKNGPADMGGMKKGDVIVALNGEPVKNIYEYMHRLKKLEKGMTITVDVMRDGKKKVLIVQL